jgi:hypothetical protein
MRLTEIRSILERAELNVQFEIIPNPQHPQHPSTVSNLAKVRKLAAELNQIPGFEPLIRRLPAVIFGTHQNNIAIPAVEAHSYNQVLNEILSVARGLKTVLTALLQQPDPNSIFIKLPEPRDLGDAVKSLASVQQAIAQVVLHEKVNGTVTLKTWEPGSFWITLLLGGPVAVGMIGAIAWAAAVVHKKIQEGRLIAAHVESLKIKNESLQDIQEKQKEQTDLLIEGEAQQILRIQLGIATPEQEREYLNRVKHSIKTFADLIDQGAQINPALEAPEDVKNLFPDFSKLGSIESRTKQITQTSTTTEGGTKS